MQKLKVVELFAGVGGFRIGLESVTVSEESVFEVIFSNQWEPSTKTRQHANEVYVNRFSKKGHSEINIEDVVKQRLVPECDVLVGGFPCQDYSVATSLRNSEGLYGKKGILWWQIERIIEIQQKPIKYLILENVDRLLKSPANQRGRDFAMILTSLDKLGYAVEWRVINAADYGFPQKRRRVFLVAFHKSTSVYKELKEIGLFEWTLNNGIFQSGGLKAEINPKSLEEIRISSLLKSASSKKVSKNKKLLNPTLNTISKRFNLGAPKSKPSPFDKTGTFLNGAYITTDFKPFHEKKDSKLKPLKLYDCLEQELEKIPPEFIVYRAKSKRALDKLLNDYKKYDEAEKVIAANPSIFIHKGMNPDLITPDNEEEVLTSKNLEKWIKLKGKKRIPRLTRENIPYTFSEGKMLFPDAQDSPSRTIITGEGGKAPSRFKHVIRHGNVLRRLTPLELERLNGFPDNHTELDGISNSKRAFFMGNALVVGLVEEIGRSLFERIQKSN